MYDVMISKYNVTDKDGGLFAAAASPYSPGRKFPFPSRGVAQLRQAVAVDCSASCLYRPLPRTASSGCAYLISLRTTPPQASFRHLLLLSLKGVAKRQSRTWRARRKTSVDSKAIPRGEQAPPQGRPLRSDPALSAVREGDLSERLHQQDDRECPPCKVHGELVHVVDKWSCQ